jgi:hypothetical protein
MWPQRYLHRVIYVKLFLILTWCSSPTLRIRKAYRRAEQLARVPRGPSKEPDNLLDWFVFQITLIEYHDVLLR